MVLAAGAKLGPYEILSPIGAGGMGEVYKAKDPRLGREVAIKVLPASFSADADRLRRFEQEAKAAGVLNHPNITAVYDIGSHDGAPYVVQELLEGETLRSVLAGGRLSPRRTVEYAREIAHGLAAAHAKGIVHRDLKPENLFVTSDNRVKILDFGLAKLTHQEEGSQSTNLPTATAGTEPGVVLGTLGYMSPEQVRGRPADARSDIFSFGAILYEMLSGQRAFHGDSAADTMSAILKEDPPDLSVTNQGISPGLERVVRHCLEKNPDLRFQSARDLAFNLEALSGTSSASIASPPGVSAARRRVPVLASAVIAAVAAAFGAGHYLWRSAAPSELRFQRITFRRGNIGNARFAPDGKTVVYGASWEGQPIEIYTTQPGRAESTPLGYKNAALFAVARTGELALSLRESFLSGSSGVGTLAKAPLGGGAPRPILDFVEWADWSPGGKDLAIIRFADGRNRIELPIGKPIYESSRGIFGLRFSPGGDRLAFLERGGTLYLSDLSGKVTRVAGPGLRGISLVWSPTGREIWLDERGPAGEGQILAVDLSGRSRVIARAPGRLIPYDVAPDGRAVVEHAVSRRRVVALAPGETKEHDLSWFDGTDLAGMSADGRTVVLNEIGDVAGDRAFYLRRTDGSPAVKLGDGQANDLSPDGKWVLVSRNDGKQLGLVPTGTGVAVLLPPPPSGPIGPAIFAADGKRVLFAAEEPGGQRGFFVQELPDGKPRKLSSGAGFAGNALSQDGARLISYGPDWTDDLIVTTLATGKSTTIPGTNTADPIRWSADGRSILALEIGSIPARVVRIDVATGRRELWKTLGPPDLSGVIDIAPVLISPDEKAYAYGYSSTSASDLYIVSGLK